MSAIIYKCVHDGIILALPVAIECHIDMQGVYYNRRSDNDLYLLFSSQTVNEIGKRYIAVMLLEAAGTFFYYIYILPLSVALFTILIALHLRIYIVYTLRLCRFQCASFSKLICQRTFKCIIC